VKEALFSALGDMSGARVLDLYAGTGALGIEALSRGAARTVFVESAPAALETLQKNIALLGIAAETDVLSISCERATPKLVARGPFDLVFADPPYAHTSKAVSTLEALAAAGALAPGATISLEHSSKNKPALKGFTIEDVRRYGDTSITIATFSTEI
jgi:16S rRNA (guanine966-N2)-methyltransferase